MAYPVDSSPYLGSTPSPAYTGTFIPEIWSGKLIEKFYAATVLAAIANTDYEGEIKSYGDKVKIRTKPTITINDYQADQPLTVQRPSSNIIEMLIDQGKYFNTVLDDVMETQMDINALSVWADDASEQMKIKIDTAVLATLTAGTDSLNKGTTAGKISGNVNLGATGSPVSLTSTNVLDAIVDLGTVLDEQNIPETGRWLIIPPWVGARVKKSDLRNASISGDGVSLMRNGRLGMIDRFTLYSSNLLPTATEGSATAFHIYGGHPHGLTFASQMTKMETLRSEQTFGTLMRGLQVYGSKVLDGIALADLYAVAG
jgi:P22 coat protein - gene protein 5.